VTGRVPFLRAKEMEQGNLTVMLTFFRKTVIFIIWTSLYSLAITINLNKKYVANHPFSYQNLPYSGIPYL